MKKYFKILLSFIFILFLFIPITFATNNNYETYTLEDLLLNILFTALFYMAIPLTIKILDVKFQSTKGVIWFVVINSIVIGLIFIIIETLSNIQDANSAPAFFYGIINYNMLKNNIDLHNLRMK